MFSAAERVTSGATNRRFAFGQQRAQPTSALRKSLDFVTLRPLTHFVRIRSPPVGNGADADAGAGGREHPLPP